MSTALFPTLAGLGWNLTRAPMWRTRIQESVSGKETATALWSFPRWQWTLSYELLRDTAFAQDWRTLCGFFLARQGMFDSFLFQDPDDNAVTGQTIGTGDGATTVFQLQRSFGAGGFTFAEPMLAPNAVASVSIGGTVQAAASYAVDAATGRLTFTGAPANGAVVAATFSYFFRCRFTADTLDFEKWATQLWQLKKLALISLK